MEDIVERTYVEASAGSVAEIVVGSVEDTAAALDAKASDVVGFAVAGVMGEAECISGWEYAHSRL